MRDGDRLVAMAGERMRLPGHVELSAICVHPQARGRGHAAVLTLSLMRHAFARGDVPFLHVRPDNIGAVALYKRLGFETRRELVVVGDGRCERRMESRLGGVHRRGIRLGLSRRWPWAAYSSAWASYHVAGGLDRSTRVQSGRCGNGRGVGDGHQPGCLRLRSSDLRLLHDWTAFSGRLCARRDRQFVAAAVVASGRPDLR